MRTNLHPQCILTSITQPIIILLIHRRQISLRHNMCCHQLANFLTKAQLSQISLTHNLMTCSANIRPVRGDHPGHLIRSWDEASHIVQKCAKYCFVVCTRVLRELRCLEGVLELRDGLADIVCVTLGFNEVEQLPDGFAGVLFGSRGLLVLRCHFLDSSNVKFIKEEQIVQEL